MNGRKRCRQELHGVKGSRKGMEGQKGLQSVSERHPDKGVQDAGRCHRGCSSHQLKSLAGYLGKAMAGLWCALRQGNGMVGYPQNVRLSCLPRGKPA
jgi:hypothetical protein